MKLSNIVADSSRAKGLFSDIAKTQNLFNINASRELSSSVKLDGIIKSIGSFNPIKIGGLISNVSSVSRKIQKMLEEAGIPKDSLTRVKLNILSIMTLFINPEEIDEIIEGIYYNDDYLNLESLLALSDDQVSDLIFDSLRTLFPMIGMVESGLTLFLKNQRK